MVSPQPLINRFIAPVTLSRLPGLTGVKRKRWTYVLIAAIFLPAGIAVSVAQAAPVRDGPVTAQLIADTSTIAPGIPFQAGIRFTMDDEWHIYWQNPGDSGAAPIITWVLPDGFTAGELRWPIPARKTVTGSTSYIYDDEVLIRAIVTPPETLPVGEPVTLKAELDWVACRENCVPGGANVSLNVDTGTAPSASPHRKRFETGTLPVAASEWIGAGTYTDSILNLSIRKQGSTDAAVSGETVLDFVKRFDFFPLTPAIVKNDPIDRIDGRGNTIRFRLPLNPQRPEMPSVFEGIFLDRGTGPETDTARAVHVRAPLAPAGGLSTPVFMAAGAGSGSINSWNYARVFQTTLKIHGGAP